MQKIKDLSISKKLLTGFGIVLVLFIVTVATATFALSSLYNSSSTYAKRTVPNADSIRLIQVNLRNLTSNMQSGMLSENQTYMEKYMAEAAIAGENLQAAINAYKNNSPHDDELDKLEQMEWVVTQAEAVQVEINRLISTGTQVNRSKALQSYAVSYAPVIEDALTLGDELAVHLQGYAEAQAAESKTVGITSFLLLISCTVLSFGVSVPVVIAIRKSILTPVKEIAKAIGVMANGNLNAEITYQSNDEIGQMTNLVRTYLENQRMIIGNMVENLTKISEGDLQVSVDINYPGDYAAIKQAMETTVEGLNNTMLMIDFTAESVSTGADAVAGGAQALASGSTQQAAAVQELNATSQEVAKKAEENQEQVKVTTEQIGKTADRVNQGNQLMKQLTESMENIGDASNQIVNITRVISDIAAQTNLLSLNAAIEAARAGEAGRGFAVVAGEVRDLAAKSSEAAKQTEVLIQNSVDSVAVGAKIAAQTARILKEVEDESQKAVEGVSKIDRISREQTLSIDSIKQGLNEVSAVIENNAATSEENSATSEEMSASAAMLSEEIKRFKLRRQDNYGTQEPSEVQDSSEIDEVEVTQEY